MTGEHEQSVEKDPSISARGENSKGDRVGMGVPVPPLDPVLKERFRAMNELPPIDPFQDEPAASAKARLEGMPLNDRRADAREARRSTKGRREGSVGNNDSSVVKDQKRAEALLARGIDPLRVSRETNLGLAVVQSLHRNRKG